MTLIEFLMALTEVVLLLKGVLVQVVLLHFEPLPHVLLVLRLVVTLLLVVHLVQELFVLRELKVIRKATVIVKCIFLKFTSEMANYGLH